MTMQRNNIVSVFSFFIAMLSIIAFSYDSTASESIILNSPAGGEKYEYGDTARIDCSFNDSSLTYNIKLWNGALCEWSSIASSLEVADFPYNWPIPSNLYGNEFRLRVSATDSSCSASARAYITLEQNLVLEKKGEEISIKKADPTICVYPQPCVGLIHVLCPDDWSPCSIINSLGQNISYSLDIKKAKPLTLDVTNLTPGVYYLLFSNENDRYMISFIKQ